MPQLDDKQLFFAQLIGLFIVSAFLSVAAYKLSDPELKMLANVAWGALLTFLRPHKA